MANRTVLGKAYYLYITEDDPKDETSRKRGGSILIPKDPEGYAELTKDPKKQKAYAAAAAKYAKQFEADCVKIAKEEFGDKYKQANWKRIVGEETQQGYIEGYWKIKAKTAYQSPCADRTGERMSNDDIDSKIENGSWVLFMIDQPKAYSKPQPCLSAPTLLGVQYYCEGAAVSGGGGGGNVSFEALPELDMEESDFDLEEDDDELDLD